jgi:transposase
MSVYVGIDVHRKRSQVAVIGQDGEVLANRNVPNGVETILKVIGGLPPGTPAAFEAAYGWGWLVELLEDYGFDPHLVHPLQCKAIASARLKNDLLTELADRSFGWCVRSPAMLARFRPRDQRRGYAAGVVCAGGAASQPKS